MENNNKPFFDPYVINNTIQNAKQIPMPTMPKFEQIPDINSGITSTTKYYEQQYMYYKYLTQVLDYQTRLIEYEKLTQNVNLNNNPNNMKNNINNR